MEPDALTKLLDAAHSESLLLPDEMEDDTSAAAAVNDDEEEGIEATKSDTVKPNNRGGSEEEDDDEEDDGKSSWLKDKSWLPKIEESKSHRAELTKKATRCITRALERFRVDSGALSRLRKALQLFVGSRRFHNYTNHKVCFILFLFLFLFFLFVTFTPSLTPFIVNLKNKQ
jgi:hypothetical protein